MDEKMTQLARRAVAAEQWRWVPGMLTDEGCRIVAVDDNGGLWAAIDMHEYWEVDLLVQGDGFEMFPDLDDDATRGCIIGIANEYGAIVSFVNGLSGPLDPDFDHEDFHIALAWLVSGGVGMSNELALITEDAP